MTWIRCVVAIVGCLAATYGCFRLGVWIIMWRFKQ
jgi:hypothetical protein